MIALHDNYLLTGDLKHKESYTLNCGVELDLSLVQKYENNLRERNPQIGWVSSVSSDNKLNLKEGDRVYTLHFVFAGGVWEQKGVEIDGGKYFGAKSSEIYFRLSNGDTWEDAEPLGEYMLVEKLTYKESPFSLEERKYRDRCTILKVSESYDGPVKPGDKVLTTLNALYPVSLNKEEKHRIGHTRIIAVINNEVPVPVNGHIVVKPFEKRAGSLLNVESTEVNKGEVTASDSDIVKAGDIIIYSNGFANKMDGYTFLTEEQVYGVVK